MTVFLLLDLQVALEINIHSSLQHQHIAGFLLAFEDSRSTHIVVEYAEGGDLRKHMPGRDEQRIRDFIVVPLLQSLTHVHNKVSTKLHKMVGCRPEPQLGGCDRQSRSLLGSALMSIAW